MADSQVTQLNTSLHVLVVFQGLMLVLFGVFTKHQKNFASGDNYGLYKDIAIMIFIGFGYLMTWLKKYGYGAVAYTMLLSCLCMQWGLLNYGFWMGCVTNNQWNEIPINIEGLVNGLFAAAAVMITFGVIIGFSSPLQLIVLTVIEVLLYQVNAWIVTVKLQAVDYGGSIVIHTFGAYFGLAVSKMLTPSKNARDFKDGEASYHSDLFSFIGTIFLWILWPSFNAYTVDAEFQSQTIVNTILALTASSIVAFYMSWLLRDRHFDPADIQNATLAGGVSIGTISNMAISPVVALSVGAAAGAISVLGFKYGPDRLEKYGIHDSCGVHNLHAMTGVFGGLASVVVTAVIPKSEDQMTLPRGEKQYLLQLAGLGVTLVVAITSGILTGQCLKAFFKGDSFSYTDETCWNIPTGQPTFTKDDEKEGLKRRRASRLFDAKQKWKKASTLLRTARAFGAINSPNSPTNEKSRLIEE